MLLKKKHKKTVTQVNRDKSPPSVWGDILYLVSKLLMVGFVLATLYFFVFGLLRYNDDSMKPALKDGDLVVYYRLDKRYSIGDLLRKSTPVSGTLFLLFVTVADLSLSSSPS